MADQPPMSFAEARALELDGFNARALLAATASGTAAPTTVPSATAAPFQPAPQRRANPTGQRGGRGGGAALPAQSATTATAATATATTAAGGDGGGNPLATPATQRTVIIKFVPPTWSDSDVRKLGDRFGTLLKVRVQGRGINKPGGFITVFFEYYERGAAAAALSATGENIGRFYLRVELSRSPILGFSDSDANVNTATGAVLVPCTFGLSAAEVATVTAEAAVAQQVPAGDAEAADVPSASAHQPPPPPPYSQAVASLTSPPATPALGIPLSPMTSPSSLPPTIVSFGATPPAALGAALSAPMGRPTAAGPVPETPLEGPSGSQAPFVESADTHGLKAAMHAANAAATAHADPDDHAPGHIVVLRATDVAVAAAARYATAPSEASYLVADGAVRAAFGALHVLATQWALDSDDDTDDDDEDTCSNDDADDDGEAKPLTAPPVGAQALLSLSGEHQPPRSGLSRLPPESQVALNAAATRIATLAAAVRMAHPRELAAVEATYSDVACLSDTVSSAAAAAGTAASDGRRTGRVELRGEVLHCPRGEQLITGAGATSGTDNDDAASSSDSGADEAREAELSAAAAALPWELKHLLLDCGDEVRRLVADLADAPATDVGTALAELGVDGDAAGEGPGHVLDTVLLEAWKAALSLVDSRGRYRLSVPSSAPSDDDARLCTAAGLPNPWLSPAFCPVLCLDAPAPTGDADDEADEKGGGDQDRTKALHATEHERLCEYLALLCASAAAAAQPLSTNRRVLVAMLRQADGMVAVRFKEAKGNDGACGGASVASAAARLLSAVKGDGSTTVAAFAAKAARHYLTAAATDDATDS